MLESTQTTGGQAYTMAYAYDRAGNLTSQRYPSDRVVDYVYDGAGTDSRSQDGRRRLVCRREGVERGRTTRPTEGSGSCFWATGSGSSGATTPACSRPGSASGRSTATGGLTATGPTPTAGLLLLNYSYGTASNNGNVLSQRIRVGGVAESEPILYLRRPEPVEDGRRKRQRHRLVADLRLRPLSETAG